MRAGVYLREARSAGGIYQYGLAVGDSLERLLGGDAAVFAEPVIAPDAGRWRLARVVALDERRPSAPRAFAHRARLLVRGRLNPSWDSSRLRAALVRFPVDLLVYPMGIAGWEAGVPYLVAIHDLQHRLQPRFPEVSADGEGELRERVFSNAIRGATLVLADSEVGRDDIVAEYGVEPERVGVLPFLPLRETLLPPPPEVEARVRSRVRKERPALLYPANFWRHKNHVRLLEAVALLREAGVEADLWLVGSDVPRFSTLEEVRATTARLGLDGRVRYLGYVSDEELSALYRLADALAMPTFFGPTNIPVLEAFAAGCPVVTSDLRGIRQQVGDAALLAEPESTEALARALGRVLTDDRERDRLVEAGRRKMAAWTEDDFDRTLGDLLDRAAELASRRRLRAAR